MTVEPEDYDLPTGDVNGDPDERERAAAERRREYQKRRYQEKKGMRPQFDQDTPSADEIIMELAELMQRMKQLKQDLMLVLSGGAPAAQQRPASNLAVKANPPRMKREPLARTPKVYQDRACPVCGTVHNKMHCPQCARERLGDRFKKLREEKANGSAQVEQPAIGESLPGG